MCFLNVNIVFWYNKSMKKESVMISNVCLRLDGKSLEAIPFYNDIFKGEESQVLTYPNDEKLVMHAEIDLGNFKIFIADNAGVTSTDALSIAITAVEGEDHLVWYEKLQADGGEVILAMEENFFATAYAIVKDKFGVTWQIMQPKMMG